jgi:signal transduction histidine kinase
MTPSASITKRLTLAVLLMELVASLLLIVTVGNHERHVQFNVFKANLRANAGTLFGALQEADARDGSIVLDLNGISMPPNAVYRVSDGEANVLGSQGDMPSFSAAPETFTEVTVGHERYLFYVLTGERAIDPGKPFAVHHHVRILYGLPVGRVWHEIFEAIRFFALATLVLLGATALLLTCLVRRFLNPIRELAEEADGINSDSWSFDAPASSRRFIELRPLASAIERSLLRLQGSFEQQRRFTSDAAHELKTDLAIVKSSLQLLSMKRRTVDEYEQGISLSLDDIGRSEGTVQKMLTLARLEQAPKNDRQSCNFAEAVLDSIAQSQPLAELKQIHVEHRIADVVAFAAMSREDAVLLCSNVLVNALQHSPTGQEVEVTVTLDGNTVRLVISDCGTGIAEEDVPFLFDAFYRGDSSRSRKTGGTGLGLAICKAICGRAGGSISIANREAGGAVVEIKLPVSSKDSLDT